MDTLGVMHEELAKIGEELRLCVPPESWAGRLATFDHANFGEHAWPPSVWEQELGAPGRTYLVVSEIPTPTQSLGSIVGVVGVTHGPEAEVLTISVARRWRGRRIGSFLLKQSLAIAKKCRSEAVFLEVRARDAIAQRLYERAGFLRVGLRRRYYGDDDAIVMSLVFPGLNTVPSE